MQELRMFPYGGKAGPSFFCALWAVWEYSHDIGLAVIFLAWSKMVQQFLAAGWNDWLI
jgi:hypothetical protein